MAYKRKTKDVVCKKCGRKGRIPITWRLQDLSCGCGFKGHRCLGAFRLKKENG